MLEVGWPDPADVLDRMESTRSCWASSAARARSASVTGAGIEHLRETAAGAVSRETPVPASSQPNIRPGIRGRLWRRAGGRRASGQAGGEAVDEQVEAEREALVAVG